MHRQKELDVPFFFSFFSSSSGRMEARGHLRGRHRPVEGRQGRTSARGGRREHPTHQILRWGGSRAASQLVGLPAGENS